MALAILCLAVREPMPLVGHGPKGFRENRERAGFYRRLSFSGGEGHAGDSYPIAEVEELVSGPLKVAQFLFVEVDLNAPMGVAESSEDRFSHVADGEQAACDGDRAVVGVACLELAGGGSRLKMRAEGINSELLQLSELLAADCDEFFFSGLGGLVGIFLAHFGGTLRVYGRMRREIVRLNR